MTYVAETIRAIGGSVSDGATCAGNAWSLASFTGTMGRRSGVWIAHDPQGASATRLFVLLVNRGAAAPSVSTKAANWVLTSGVSVFIPASETVDIYLRNDSNAATTSVYSAKEVLA